MGTSKVKYVQKDFSYQNLIGANLSPNDYIECSFRHADLTRADLCGCVLYKSDMTGARLVGANIALTCHTFKEVTYDRNQIEYLMYLLLLANIPDYIRKIISSIVDPNKKKKFDLLFEN